MPNSKDPIKSVITDALTSGVENSADILLTAGIIYTGAVSVLFCFIFLLDLTQTIYSYSLEGPAVLEKQELKKILDKLAGNQRDHEKSLSKVLEAIKKETERQVKRASSDESGSLLGFLKQNFKGKDFTTMTPKDLRDCLEECYYKDPVLLTPYLRKLATNDPMPTQVIDDSHLFSFPEGIEDTVKNKIYDGILHVTGLSISGDAVDKFKKHSYTPEQLYMVIPKDRQRSVILYLTEVHHNLKNAPIGEKEELVIKVAEKFSLVPYQLINTYNRQGEISSKFIFKRSKMETIKATEIMIKGMSVRSNRLFLAAFIISLIVLLILTAVYTNLNGWGWLERFKSFL